jgi:hypothetical protein
MYDIIRSPCSEHYFASLSWDDRYAIVILFSQSFFFLRLQWLYGCILHHTASISVDGCNAIVILFFQSFFLRLLQLYRVLFCIIQHQYLGMIAILLSSSVLCPFFFFYGCVLPSLSSMMLCYFASYSISILGWLLCYNSLPIFPVLLPPPPRNALCCF